MFEEFCHGGFRDNLGVVRPPAGGSITVGSSKKAFNLLCDSANNFGGEVCDEVD